MDRKSDLIMEIHYQHTGKQESDQSEVGIYFTHRKARQVVMEVQVQDRTLMIPAGAKRHHHKSSFTFPVATTVMDVVPHMHLLGREMKATATLPDNTVLPLVWIQDWDFNWQGQYTYQKPITLPKGTRIDVDSWYDNSAANPLNPNSPPKKVGWGIRTTDEMDICHFHCTCATAKDFKSLQRFNAEYVNSTATAQRRLLGR